MTLRDFNFILDKIFQDLQNLMLEKNEQYASEDDIFKNFRKASSLLNISKEKYLWILKTKHELALYEMIQKNDFNLEEVKSRVYDCILYLIIFYCMVLNNYSDE